MLVILPGFSFRCRNTYSQFQEAVLSIKFDMLMSILTTQNKIYN